jgi:hypothetical protein
VVTVLVVAIVCLNRVCDAAKLLLVCCCTLVGVMCRVSLNARCMVRSRSERSKADCEFRMPTDSILLYCYSTTNDMGGLILGPTVYGIGI